jgi:hypothetical protein
MPGCCGLRGDPNAALLAAAVAGDAEAVRSALRRGASVDARDAKLGGTALAHAALHGHLHAIEALLLHGAPDVRAKDRVGDTACHWAALNGHAAAVAVLLANGADVGERNFDGDTALDMAGRGVGVDARTAEAVRSVLAAAAPRGLLLGARAAPPDGADSTRVIAPPDLLASPASDSAAPSVGADWALDATKLQFLEKVASGSFGDVFRGTYLGAEVAIKALRLRADTEQAAVVSEFLAELAVLRRIRHKHVVQLIGASAGPPACVLVTEFMRGGALASYLRRVQRPLPAARQLGLVCDVARGMDYLHNCNIVHRDLKAANLLLNEHGECKVADFGLARVVDGAAGSMTAETGTYRWMAPEVIRAARYDARCDVYSFGVVCWEVAAAGEVPYAGLPAMQVALQVAQAGLRPGVPPAAPPALARLMVACWAESPDARPLFGALVTTLEQALAAEDTARAAAPAAAVLKTQ